MNVLIKKDANGNSIGWEMTAENAEEIQTVNAIRDMSFFGFKETSIAYNGRTNGTSSSAGTLHWIQKQHSKNK